MRLMDVPHPHLVTLVYIRHQGAYSCSPGSLTELQGHEDIYWQWEDNGITYLVRSHDIQGIQADTRRT